MASGTFTTPTTANVGDVLTAAKLNTELRDNVNAASGNVAEVRISRAAGQAVSSGAVTSISFDTETTDTDGFFAPTSPTVTIPTGFGGRYLITFTCHWTGAPTTRTFTRAEIGGRVYNQASNGSETDQMMTVSMRLAAAQTLQFGVFQQSGATMGATATLEIQRTAI